MKWEGWEEIESMEMERLGKSTKEGYEEMGKKEGGEGEEMGGKIREGVKANGGEERKGRSTLGSLSGLLGALALTPAIQLQQCNSRTTEHHRLPLQNWQHVIPHTLSEEEGRRWRGRKEKGREMR